MSHCFYPPPHCHSRLCLPRITGTSARAAAGSGRSGLSESHRSQFQSHVPCRLRGLCFPPPKNACQGQHLTSCQDMCCFLIWVDPNKNRTPIVGAAQKGSIPKMGRGERRPKNNKDTSGSDLAATWQPGHKAKEEDAQHPEGWTWKGSIIQLSLAFMFLFNKTLQRRTSISKHKLAKTQLSIRSFSRFNTASENPPNKKGNKGATTQLDTCWLKQTALAG